MTSSHQMLLLGFKGTFTETQLALILALTIMMLSCDLDVAVPVHVPSAKRRRSSRWVKLMLPGYMVTFNLQ